jgi:hypothetical protein
VKSIDAMTHEGFEMRTRDSWLGHLCPSGPRVDIGTHSERQVNISLWSEPRFGGLLGLDSPTGQRADECDPDNAESPSYVVFELMIE